MIIDVLVCKPDGTQTIEPQEFPDDFFTQPTPEPTEIEKLRADFDYLVMVQGVDL